MDINRPRAPAGTAPGAASDAAEAQAGALLAASERETERVANIVRMAAAFLLLVGVFIAGEDLPTDDDGILRQIEGAKLTLALWCLGGALGLVALRLGAPVRPLGYVSVTIDAALIFANLGYAASGGLGDRGFLFASPGLWIVPIALASVCLRWQPRMMIYAGAVYALGIGWLTFADGFVPIAERASYLMKYGLLFGPPPNGMRMLMLALFAIILAVITWRGRRLILSAAAETERRLRLGRFLPAELTPLLADGQRSGLRRGEVRTIAALFVDLRGSTRIAARVPPEQMARTIGAFRELVSDAASRHGGVIDKFIGDGALVVFGLFGTAGEAASRGLDCALDLARELAAGRLADPAGAPLDAGIGLHCGACFVGVIDARDRLEFTAIGDGVNIAAKLEHATRRYGCRLLVSAATLDLAGRDGAAAGLAPVSVAGIDGGDASIEAFRL